jgi:flagellar hook assembly protein FlgD
VTLDGSLPIARITSPDPDELVAGTVTIEGTAAGMDFDSYTVGYKSGIDPAGGSWVTIASSATPVTDGVLATWNASTLNTPTVSLRLSVATTGVATAQDVVVVPLLAITSIATAPTFLSPNGDAVQDETALTAALSWPADWELTVAPVGGGPAVRTYQGSASAVAQAWDGADELAAVVADGEYTLALEATAPGGASTTKSVTVEVDTVAPVAAITTPTAQQMVLSHEPFQIEGAAHDDHFKLYQLSIAPGAPPGAFTTLKSSAVPVEGIPTMDDLYLLPTQSYASDVYTLRLAVSDDAGNVSTLDREFELDYIQITDVGSTPAVIDPAASETAEIAYTVNRDCDVAVDLHAWPAGVLIRTLTQTGVLAGPNTAMWDGLDDLGVFSTPEVLHYFVIQATDASGRTGQYNDATTPKLGPSGSVGGISIDTAGFDPYANDEIEVEFNITGLARSQIWVKGSNLFLPLSETGVFPPGQHVGRWDGRNQLGGLHQGAFSFFVDDPSNLPSPAIYLAREPIRFADFRAEAYLIHPVFGQVSGFTYELTRDAVVTITVEDPNGNHVRTLLTAQPQTAGVYDLDDGIGWDGRDDAGNVVSLEGTYTVVLSATDLLTGKVHVRRGNVTVYR